MGQNITSYSSSDEFLYRSPDGCLITCFAAYHIMCKRRRPHLRRKGPLKQILQRLSYPHAVHHLHPKGTLADSFSIVAVVWHLIQEFLGVPPQLRVATFEPDPWTYTTTVKVSHRGLQQVLQSRVLTGHQDIILAIAMEGTTIITGSYDETAMIWDAAHGDLQVTLACSGAVFTVAIEQDVAITGTMQGTMQVWDLHKLSGKVNPGSFWLPVEQDDSPFRFSLQPPFRAPVLALAKRGRTVATGSADANAYVWDSYKGQLCHILKGHHGSIEAVALHPNLHLMVTGSSDATARLWNTSTGESLQVFRVGTDTNSDVPQMCLPSLTQRIDSVVAVALKGTKIAIASAHGKVRIWNRQSGKPIVQDDGLSLNQCRQGVRGGIDMHEDGTVIVCWKAGFATIWNSNSNTPQFVITSGFSAGDTGNAVCRAWLD